MLHQQCHPAQPRQGIMDGNSNKQQAGIGGPIRLAAANPARAARRGRGWVITTVLAGLLAPPPGQQLAGNINTIYSYEYSIWAAATEGMSCWLVPITLSRAVGAWRNEQ